MKVHNKLVRDRIPQIISGNGGVAHVRVIASDDEFIVELSKKLIEEAREVQETPSIEELADVKEVLDALVEATGYTQNDLEEAQTKKATSNGAFKKRLFLIDTIG